MSRHPLTFAFIAVLIPLVAIKVLDAVIAASATDLPSRLVIEALFAGYVAVLLTRLDWWHTAGFRRPEAPRRSLAILPLFLLPLLVFAGSGIKAAAADRVVGFVVFAVLVGFAEEGLLRGVVLRVLLPAGRGRAVLISSLIFGFGHLGNVLTGASVSMTAVQVVEDAFLGIAFAGACLYAGTIWPVVGLHALLDLVDAAGRGFAFPPPQTSAAPVLIPIVLTGLCALYGWWLLRQAPRESGPAPAS